MENFNSLALAQDEHPEQTGEEEQNAHHKVKSRKRHFTGGEEVLAIRFLNVYLKATVNNLFKNSIKPICMQTYIKVEHKLVHTIVRTGMEIQVVQAFFLIGRNPHHKLE